MVLRFLHSADRLWNIDDIQYIKLPEAIGAQDVRSILPVGEQLWVGAGHWITVLDKGMLSAKVCHARVQMQQIQDRCV